MAVWHPQRGVCYCLCLGGCPSRCGGKYPQGERKKSLFLRNFAVKLTIRNLESRSYLWSKFHDPNSNLFWLIHPCDGQTDGQTDGRALAYSALCALSRAKNLLVVGWLRLACSSVLYVIVFTTFVAFVVMKVRLVHIKWPVQFIIIIIVIIIIIL